jgi:hypothetical protein
MGDDERIEAALENQAGDTLSLQRGCPEPKRGAFPERLPPAYSNRRIRRSHLSDPTITLGSFRSREESRFGPGRGH